MKAIFSMKVACLSLAMAVASCAWAQEATEGSSETAAAASSENATEGAKPAEAPAPAGKDFRFLPLMRCVAVRGGSAEICPQGGTP